MRPFKLNCKPSSLDYNEIIGYNFLPQGALIENDKTELNSYMDMVKLLRITAGDGKYKIDVFPSSKHIKYECSSLDCEGQMKLTNNDNTNGGFLVVDSVPCTCPSSLDSRQRQEREGLVRKTKGRGPEKLKAALLCFFVDRARTAGSELPVQFSNFGPFHIRVNRTLCVKFANGLWLRLHYSRDLSCFRALPNDDDFPSRGSHCINDDEIWKSRSNIHVEFLAKLDDDHIGAHGDRVWPNY